MQISLAKESFYVYRILNRMKKSDEIANFEILYDFYIVSVFVSFQNLVSIHII